MLFYTFGYVSSRIQWKKGTVHNPILTGQKPHNLFELRIHESFLSFCFVLHVRYSREMLSVN